jgi:hypothetical protein
MAKDPGSATGKGASNARDDRLKAALKANLARRKKQARVRKSSDTDAKGKEQE